MYSTPRTRKVRRYSVNKPRFIRTIIIAAAVLALLLSLPSWLEDIMYPPYKVQDFLSGHLEMYFRIGEEHDVPWYYLAAVDRAEGISSEDTETGRTGRIAIHLRGIRDPEQLDDFLREYKDDRKFIKDVRSQVK